MQVFLSRMQLMQLNSKHMSQVHWFAIIICSFVTGYVQPAGTFYIHKYHRVKNKSRQG